LGAEAYKACYNVKYFRLPELLSGLAEAKLKGEYKKMITKY
jgi:hypothetical protein